MKLKKQVFCNQKSNICNQKSNKPIFKLLKLNDLQGQKTSNIIFNIIIKLKRLKNSKFFKLFFACFFACRKRKFTTEKQTTQRQKTHIKKLKLFLKFFLNHENKGVTNEKFYSIR